MLIFDRLYVKLNWENFVYMGMIFNLEFSVLYWVFRNYVRNDWLNFLIDIIIGIGYDGFLRLLMVCSWLWCL